MFSAATSCRRSSTTASTHAAALVIPRTQRCLANRAFSVAEPSTRNCLPYNVSNCQSFARLYLHLKTHFFAPGSESAGNKVPRSESSMELSLLGAKVPGNESCRERKFHGTFAPGNESSRERKFHPMELSLPGAKVPRSKSSSIPI